MVESILEIVELEFLQNLQDFFSKTMNMASVITDKNGYVTQPSNFSAFCTKLMRGNKKICKKCIECERKWGNLGAELKTPQTYICHSGIKHFAIPLLVENEHVATFLGGQVLTAPQNDEKLKELANKFEINEAEFIKEAKKISIISNEKWEGAIDFLYNVGNAISAVLLANFKLSKLGMDYRLNKQLSIENMFFSKGQKITLPITDREFDVLKLIVLGKNNNEIAEELCISVHTAKAHVSSILEKFIVDDRVQVAVKAIKEGLV